MKSVLDSELNLQFVPILCVCKDCMFTVGSGMGCILSWNYTSVKRV